MKIDRGKEIPRIRRSVRYGNKLCVFDRSFAIVDVDDDYLRLIGYSPEEKDKLLGTLIHHNIYSEDVDRIASEVMQSGEDTYDCKYRLKTKSGRYMWVRDIGEIVEEDGKRYVQSTAIDIEEKEYLIRQRDVTFENIPGGVLFIVTGKDNFYVREANRHYFEMLGVEREGYLGSSGKYTFLEDLPRLREHLVTQAARREPVDFEFRMKTGHGNVAWYRMLGNYFDTRKDGEEYLCIMIDITNRKIVQFDLMKEKENYRMAMRNTADLMYEYDVEEKKLRLAGEDYVTGDTKLCLGDRLDLDYRDLIFRRDLIYKGDRKKITNFIRNGVSHYDNIRMLTQNRKTGKVYYDNYEIFMNKVFNGGRLTRVVGYLKKISYKTIPITVRQELHQIFDEHILKDFSFILKIDVQTGSFSPYFIEDYDWESYSGNRYYDTFLSWWCTTMVAKEEQKEISYFLSLEQMLRILYSGEPSGYHFCMVRGRDSEYRYKICTYSFYGPDVNTVILAVRDVNAVRAEQNYREQADQRILMDVLTEARQAVEDRREFMDYLIRELSAPIMAMKEFLGDEENPDMLGNIARGIDYMGEMLESISEYNQKEVLYNQFENRSNLYNVCTQVCEEERRNSIGLNISIHEYILLPKDRMYFIHGLRFKEILINILGNAIKYAPKGSNINLHVSEEDREESKCVIAVTLEDEGPAIHGYFFERTVDEQNENDIRDKMLVLRNTGYSIALASKIIGLLGGDIAIRGGGVHGRGIDIRIPVYISDNDAAGEELAETGKEFDGNGLRGQGILLVENESREYTLTAPLLRANGADVYVAATGGEAIELLKRYASSGITAVLMDKELTDMTCYELARKLRDTKNYHLRRIPIIEMMSGIQSGDVRLGLTSGINATIHKPVNLSRLILILENLQKAGPIAPG